MTAVRPQTKTSAAVRASTDRSLAASRHLTWSSFSLVAAPRRVEDDRSQLVMSSLDPMTDLILDPARSVD
jgi:hypothetical protein